MSRYVITITPDNGGAPSAETAHTTVRVDTSTGQTRITELTVRAASGGGLAPADLPPVDLDLLVRALTSPAPAQALPSSDEPVAAPESAPESTPEPAPEPEAAVDTVPEPVAVEEPAGTAPRRTRKAAKKAVAKKAAGRKATAAKKATAKAAPRRRAAAEAAPTTAGTRAYRRMPEADQVMEVYQQTGSITGVAEHFEVPRHTVAGWARRLRSMGHAIGRQ